MSQAKRLNRKRLNEPDSAKKTSSNNIPWGLLCVIAVCIALLLTLLDGATSKDNSEIRLGSGLRVLFEKKAAKKELAAESDEESAAEIAELMENQSSEKEFGFYEILPDIDRVMPDDLPEAAPARARDDVYYYMQAASFKSFADAEKLRARLTQKGHKCITESREVAGKGLYYRIRLGPFRNKRKAKTAKNKLQKLGVDPFIYTVKK